jgi:iron complex outermembrane recepter protein
MAKFRWGRMALMSTSILVALPTVAAAQDASGAGAAQTPPQAASPATVGDIIVTARRREERVQDVPVAVTALSPEQLTRANVANVDDLTEQVPGLISVPGTGGGGRAFPSFAIRGQSQQESTILVDGSVGVYFNEIPAARPQGSNQGLVDIQSVEVLKGPQGTLFGRNSTGGAIVIRPNQPQDVFEASLGATLGNHKTRNLEGMINLPLAEGVALRLAGGVFSDDGYLYDEILKRNINYTDYYTFRAGLAFQPTDALRSTFYYTVFSEDDGGTGGFVNAVNPNGVFNSAAARAARNYGKSLEQMLAEQQARGIYRTASGVPMFTKVDTEDFSNITTWDVSDSLTVKNIIGYRTVDSHVLEDADGLEIPLLPIERIDGFHQVTNEFQLLGQTGKLNWIGGLFYFREKGENQGVSVSGAVDPGPLEPDTVFGYNGWVNNNQLGVNTSYAVFAQGTYDLGNWIDGVSLTLGLRQTWDEKEATIRNRTATTCRFTVDADNNPATPEVNPGLAGCSLTSSAEFDALTYNASLDWKVDADTLLYVAARRGYRSGGFSARATTQEGLRRPYQPEFVNDFELGAKKDWNFANGAFLRTNLALFNSDYTDIQRYVTDLTVVPTVSFIVNAAEATVRGAEFEWLFRPTAGFELSGFYSHLDAKFDEFIYQGRDNSGFPLARAPRNTFSVTGKVDLPIDPSWGAADLALTYFKTDEYSSADDFTPLQVIPGHELWSLNSQWSNVMGSDVDAVFFVNNLFDEEYVRHYTSVFPSLGYDSLSPGSPRTFGVKLKVSFGR